MAKSTNVISIKIDAAVSGQEAAGKLAEQLRALARASEEAQTRIAKISAGKLISACGSISMAMQGLQSSLAGATEDYAKFDAAMRAANTMAGKDAAGFETLKSQVTDMAKAIPMARDALANGLYQAISNGVPEDNIMSFLEASAKSSVGGLADLGGVVTVTSTIIKNYGYAWADAAAIQDKIQTTAKNGVTSFEQLQAALPKVTGNAAELGVGIDELLASFATLTGVSGNTAEVSTQMAAVFTALIKPSKEAAKMAEEMGIQFNAASIKAAGGLQPFLMQLDVAVSEFAAASGMLEKEVYAKLFGSAQALAAIGPLTGQLAAKFGENVDAMANSGGAIEQAFADMSQTAEAQAQLTKNKWAEAMDAIGSAAVKVKPALDFTASFAMTASGVTSLVAACKGGASAMLAFGRAMKAAYAGSVALSAGLKALTSATLVGAALTAVFMAVDYFANSADKAAKKTDELRQKLADLKQGLDEAYKQAGAAARSEMDAEIAKLGKLVKSHKDASAAVATLNQKYGEAFGTFKTAKEWYDTLTAKSREYAKAMAYEGLAREASNKRAKIDMEIDDVNEQLDAKYKERKAFIQKGGYYLPDMAQVLADRNGQYLTNNRTEAGLDLDREIKLLEGKRRQLQAQAAAASEQISKANAKVDAIMADIKQPEAKQPEAKQPEAPDTKTPKAKETTETETPSYTEVMTRDMKNLADFDKALSDLRAIQKQADADMVRVITDSIEQLENERDAFLGKAEQAASQPVAPEWAKAMPAKLKTIEDYDRAIESLEWLQKKASDAELGNINREIKRLKDLKEAKENAGLPAKKTEKTDGEGAYDSSRSAWQGVGGAVSAAQQMAKAGDANANAWERASNAISGFFAIFDNIKSVAKALNQLGKAMGIVTAATEASATAKEVDAAATQGEQMAAINEVSASPSLVTAKANEAAASTASANAKMADAAAGFFAAHSWIPFVGVGLAAAGVAAMMASLFSMRKFAQGGLVYGPTLGLFGEYPGASNNPEVVAPLSKLRDIIGSGEGGSGEPLSVEFVLRADRLVAAVDRWYRKKNRIGG